MTPLNVRNYQSRSRPTDGSVERQSVGGPFVCLDLPPRFVVWKHQNGQKPPLSPSTLQPANPQIAENWLSLDAARALVSGGKADGTGISLSAELGLFCIDFDGRMPDDPLVRNILRRYGSTYVELSPSGKGCHVWFRTAPGVSVNQHRNEIGAYTDRQYVTLTGWDRGEDGLRFGSFALTYLTAEEVERLVSELHSPREAEVEEEHEPDHDGWVDIDTDAVLEAALNAGTKNDSHFRLHFGGWEQRYKYTGHAIHAYAGRTKYWIWRQYDIENGDDVTSAVMTLSRRSALYRHVVANRGEDYAEREFLQSARKVEVLKTWHENVQAAALKRYPTDHHLNQLADCLPDGDLGWLRKAFRIGCLVKEAGRSRTTVFRWLARMRDEGQAELNGQKWRILEPGLRELQERINRRIRGTAKKRFDSTLQQITLPRTTGPELSPPKSRAATFEFPAEGAKRQERPKEFMSTRMVAKRLGVPEYWVRKNVPVDHQRPGGCWGQGTNLYARDAVERLRQTKEYRAYLTNPKRFRRSLKQHFKKQGLEIGFLLSLPIPETRRGENAL